MSSFGAVKRWKGVGDVKEGRRQIDVQVVRLKDFIKARGLLCEQFWSIEEMEGGWRCEGGEDVN